MMEHRSVILSCGLVIALVAGACSSSSTDPAAPTTVAEGIVSTTTQDGSGETETTTPDTTQAPPTTVVSEPVITGADPITQTTPTIGGGTRPLLEWDAVDGAALYFVTIYTESGGSYWAAVTEDTKTYVGGPQQISEGRTGPSVADGYTWVVYAEDADGNLLAASPSRPIAP